MRGLLRAVRVGVAQILPLLPDLINWVAGTALPVIPPPWNIVVGALLNGIGKAVRDRNQGWVWVPV